MLLEKRFAMPRKPSKHSDEPITSLEIERRDFTLKFREFENTYYVEINGFETEILQSGVGNAVRVESKRTRIE